MLVVTSPLFTILYAVVFFGRTIDYTHTQRNEKDLQWIQPISIIKS